MPKWSKPATRAPRRAPRQRQLLSSAPQPSTFAHHRSMETVKRTAHSAGSWRYVEIEWRVALWLQRLRGLLLRCDARARDLARAFAVPGADGLSRRNHHARRLHLPRRTAWWIYMRKCWQSWVLVVRLSRSSTFNWPWSVDGCVVFLGKICCFCWAAPETRTTRSIHSNIILQFSNSNLVLKSMSKHSHLLHHSVFIDNNRNGIQSEKNK